MESQNIEYKVQWRDEYLKWICGFANAQGGKIFIGIDDDGKVVGVNDAKKLMEDIPNKACDTMGVVVNVNLHKNNDLQYIEIIVEPYPYPVSYKGQYHFRSGSTKQELRGAALDRFMLNKQGKTWDGVPVPYITENELDKSELARFRQLVRKKKRMSSLDIDVDDHTLLEKLRLFDGDYLKRASVLLFAPDPEKFISGAFVKIGMFGNDDSDLLYQDEIHGPLFKQIFSLMDLIITKYMKAMIRYEGIQRIEEYPITEEVLREALLNSLIHKDYSRPVPVQISVYDDRMMIWNCGTLPEKWTVETLKEKHGSYPFNPEIANAFFRAGEIESWGRGIEKIMTICKDNGNPAPQFNYDGVGLWTILKYPLKQQSAQVDLSSKDIDNERVINIFAKSCPSLAQVCPSSLQNIITLMESCRNDMSVAEMVKITASKSRRSFVRELLNPLLEVSLVAMRFPDKPNSPKQKYYLTDIGVELLKTIYNV